MEGGLATGLLHVVGVGSAHVSRREIVADRVESAHAVNHGARRTILDSAADLGCLAPDNLGVVAPFVECCHIRGVLPVVVTGEEVDLAVVPHFGNGSLQEDIGARVANITAGSPHGNVLAVAATASYTAFRVSIYRNTKGKSRGNTHVSWAKVQEAAVMAA